ncbi:DUF4376 domain-containing protein [Burkholderia cepacia]|uniref:DUF4376 domain-containing protein n=1 Tax=Burkholderia cepacia TaxID=292 RepID=UPI0026DF5E87|nr:hypothetical protein [Burkholderia cepacia]MDO5940653.1 hypothetical protein [Burkholderia cepacia]
MGKKLAAYDSTSAAAIKPIIAFYDSVTSPPPGDASTVEITDAQWQTCLSQQGQWGVSGDALAQVPPPTTAQQLASAQAEQIARVDSACAMEICAGFASSALGQLHGYPSKPTDQQNLSASVLASLIPNRPAGWTTSFWCADSNGVWAYREHTAEQIQQVGMDGKAAISASIARKIQLEQQIMAAATVDAIKQIVW